jgi:16S rRNA G1207 methylase RsmC
LAIATLARSDRLERTSHTGSGEPSRPRSTAPDGDQPAPDQSVPQLREPAEGERRILQVTLVGQDVEVVTADGVFSGSRLDLGTRVLFREAPTPPPSGDLLDLGCGWGPIALTMAMVSPQATVWAVDVNERALELTRENAARLQLPGVRAVTPSEVPDEVRFTAIWSNPPIRVGKQELHALLTRWLPRLTPGGKAHLVVQRNLGADSLHTWLTAELGEGFSVTRAGSAKGYRMLRVARGSAATGVDDRR